MSDEKPSVLTGSGLSTPTLYASSEMSGRNKPHSPPSAAASVPHDPDRLQRWIVAASAIVVVAVVAIVAGMMVLITPSRDTGPQNVVGAQGEPPRPSGPVPARPSPTGASGTGGAAPTAVNSQSAKPRRPPAATTPSRDVPPATVPTLTVGATVGLEIEGRPGLRLRHHDFIARVDPLSPASSAQDKAESSFVVRQGLAFDNCVSFEAVSHPGFYLRRFFSDLLLHKQEDGDIYRQETTFCPVPTRSGKGLTLLVLFPSGFTVTTAPDGRLRLENADRATPTGFVVRRPF